jgi:hypothetical protein
MQKPHKRLDAWQEAIALTVATYRITERFPKEHRFSLTDQIHRAVLSVASNIAEGAARQTKKEFANYLHIAQGSQWMELDKRMNHIDKLLSGLLKYLKANSTRPPNPSPLTPHQ